MSSLNIVVNGITTTLQIGTPSVFNLVVQQSSTFAGIPASPAGLYFVAADETKNGNPTFYYFNGGHRYWIAMVKDA